MHEGGGGVSSLHNKSVVYQVGGSRPGFAVVSIASPQLPFTLPRGWLLFQRFSRAYNRLSYPLWPLLQGACDWLLPRAVLLYSRSGA